MPKGGPNPIYERNIYFTKVDGGQTQGSGNSIFTEWASRLPLRMKVAFGPSEKLPPNLKGFQVKTT